MADLFEVDSAFIAFQMYCMPLMAIINLAQLDNGIHGKQASYK